MVIFIRLSFTTGGTTPVKKAVTSSSSAAFLRIYESIIFWRRERARVRENFAEASILSLFQVKSINWVVAHGRLGQMPQSPNCVWPNVTLEQDVFVKCHNEYNVLGQMSH